MRRLESRTAWLSLALFLAACGAPSERGSDAFDAHDGQVTPDSASASEAPAAAPDAPEDALAAEPAEPDAPGSDVAEISVDTGGQGCAIPGCQACDYCAAPYPGCAYIGNQWACVQCTEDAHCGGSCTCNLEQYACEGAPCQGDPPPAQCTDDADCRTDQAAYVCDVPSAMCYDPAGTCDGALVNCNWLEGASCEPGGLGSLPLPGIPGMPGSGDGYCSCSTPIDQAVLLDCLGAGTCPDDGCFEGQACIQIPLLCGFLECPPLPPEGGACVNVAALQALLP